VWDPIFENLWPPFVAVREGILDLTDAPKQLRQVYWLFDEIIRQVVLFVLSGANYPISISIPTTNNPNYP
jgi:hypothetical protein